MKQLSLSVTPEFEAGLGRYMEQKNIRTKSDAIRLALREAVGRRSRETSYDSRSWLGLALKAPLSRKPGFRSEDELWS